MEWPAALKDDRVRGLRPIPEELAAIVDNDGAHGMEALSSLRRVFRFFARW
jgi:hypothetical protein